VYYKCFGSKRVGKQDFGSKEHKPWFSGHHSGWNLGKTDDASSVFFSKKIGTDDMSSTPGAGFFKK
jgi:hypothetical protein